MNGKIIEVSVMFKAWLYKITSVHIKLIEAQCSRADSQQLTSDRSFIFKANRVRREQESFILTSQVGRYFVWFCSIESLYGGQFTLSTQLMEPNYLVILPTDAAPQFR